MRALSRAATSSLAACAARRSPRGAPRAAARRGAAAAAAAAAGPAADAADPAAALLKWVTDGGGLCEGNVQLASEGGAGWGLTASRALSKGEPVMRLPRSLALTYSEAGSDPRLLTLVQRVPAELWSMRLALALLAERARGEESDWAPYIALLPASYPGCPLFWSGEDLQELQYPPLAAQVAKRCRFLLDFSKGELEGLPDKPDQDPFGGVSVEVNGLGWALAATSSRAFRAAGPRQPGALLPLIDMCNHSFEPNCAIEGDKESGSSGALTVVAQRDIAEGEALSLCYGELPNDFLLLDYHFVADVNRNDVVELAFDARMFSAAAQVSQVPEPNLNKDGEPHPWQLKSLEKLCLVGRGADRKLSVRALPGKEIDPRLVAAARVLAAQREEDLQGAHGQLALEGRLETNATLLVVSQLVLTLQTFATSMDEDVEALKLVASGKTQMTAARLNATRFRLGKKRAVLAAIGVLTDELGEERHAQFLNLGDGSEGQMAAAPAVQGEKRPPRAATSKGFGKR